MQCKKINNKDMQCTKVKNKKCNAQKCKKHAEHRNKKKTCSAQK